MTTIPDADVRTDQLITFALKTLAILKRDTSWSPDTLEAIADEAMALNLAVVDEDGLFHQIPFLAPDAHDVACDARSHGEQTCSKCGEDLPRLDDDDAETTDTQIRCGACGSWETKGGAT